MLCTHCTAHVLRPRCAAFFALGNEKACARPEIRAIPQVARSTALLCYVSVQSDDPMSEYPTSEYPMSTR
jgi:hypothetical protein